MNARSRLVLLVGIFVLLALVAVGWFFVLGPRVNEAAALQARAAQIESANIALLGRYNEVLQQARNIETATSEAQEIFARMPEEADLPAVITQVTEAAAEAGIPPGDIQVINTSVPEPVESQDDTATAGVALATMRLDVTVRGTPDELLRFLANVEGLDRSLLIQSTSMTLLSGAEAAGSTLQVTGEMFVLQSDLDDLVKQVKRVITEAGITDSSSDGQ